MGLEELLIVTILPLFAIIISTGIAVYLFVLLRRLVTGLKISLIILKTRIFSNTYYC